MAITVKHSKVSTIPDDTDASLVRPSDWNADHTLVGLGTMAEQNANAVAITGGTISGVTVSGYVPTTRTITAGTGLTGGGDLSANRTLAIANTAVTAASYGSASKTLTATVNAQGQLTALADTNIAITNTQVSGLGTASTKDAGAALGVATLDSAGKVPISQIPDSVIGALSYQGTWNASTNTPTLTSSVGTKGYYYVVSVAGNTNLNGITDWLVGDWAVYNGTAWQKVDNTDSVTSVNGYTGAVTLTYTDVGAFPATSTTGTGNVVLATGATQANPTISNYENFTPTTAPSYSEGRVWYDSTEKALAFYNDSSALAVHVAQDLIVKVINNTGSTIANGSPVYITSTSSGQTYPNVALARADVAATSSVIGLTNGAIANGSIGYVSAQGLIDNVNTSTFTVGQVLYLSPYSAGQLMNTIPPTGITVQVGVVSFVNSSTGKIYVKQTTPLAVPASIITGTLGVANGGTGATTLTGYVKGSGTSAMTASSTIPTTDLSGTVTNAQLANSAITINGTSTSLGGSISVGTVTSVTGTSPVVSSGGATPAISMPAATSSVNGYLTSTDWNTFNSKGSGTVTSVSATAPLTSSGGNTPNLAMPAATTAVSGYLTNTDWTTFNNKGNGTVTSVAALIIGTTGTDLSSTVANGTTTPVITLQVPTASATNRGALSSTDWSTFNGKQAALVSGTNIKTINTNSIVGSGDLTISASPAGSTTQVQYNNAGALGASSTFTFASSTLTAPTVSSSNGVFSTPNGNLGAGNATRFKNRIINGDMRIDQRNAGASTTPAASGYLLDRFAWLGSIGSKLTFGQNLNSATPPTGFTKYLGVQTASATTPGASDYYSIYQAIEGLNMADLAWGTASAKTLTLSFQVYSSLTGTFGGSIYNASGNRCYPFAYTISSANTWTTATVTIPGDTTGTWATDNSAGMVVMFGLGAGSTVSGTAGSWGSTLYRSSTGAVQVVATASATFYITGVQLEVGSSATGFDLRDFGTEMLMCQRYFEKSYNYEVKPGTASSIGPIVNFPTQYVVQFFACYKVPKRTDATMTYYSALTGAAGYYTYNYTNDATVNAVSTGQTSASCYAVTPGNVSAYIHFTASAEL